MKKSARLRSKCLPVRNRPWRPATRTPSCQSRPGKSDFISLKQHAKQLNKYTRIKFIEDIIGKKAEKAIKELKPGQAILLDNIRFEKDEFFPEKGKNNKIVKFFLPLIDIYVNDAFSNSHRNHTSMVSFPKYILVNYQATQRSCNLHAFGLWLLLK